MTFVALAIFGVGLILIGSALDNTPIGDTFAKVLLGQELNWSGTASGASGQSGQSGQSGTQPRWYGSPIGGNAGGSATRGVGNF